jgi:hypothetical protein
MVPIHVYNATNSELGTYAQLAKPGKEIYIYLSLSALVVLPYAYIAAG